MWSLGPEMMIQMDTGYMVQQGYLWTGSILGQDEGLTLL